MKYLLPLFHLGHRIMKFGLCKTAEAKLMEVTKSRDQIAKAKASLNHVIQDLESAERTSQEEIKQYKITNAKLVAQTKELEKK